MEDNQEYQIDAILTELENEQPREEISEKPASDLPIRQEPEPVHVSPKSAPPKKKKKKKSSGGCLSTFLWLLGIFVISVGLAVVGVIFASDYLGVGKDFIQGQKTKHIQLTIEEGTAVRSIAQELEENDVLISDKVFLAYLKLTGKGNNVNYGAHDFKTNMGYGEILDSLAQPAKAEDISVTIRSGNTLDQIFETLENAEVCTVDELKEEALHGTFRSELYNEIPKDDRIHYALEGYLFPDTYKFYKNDSPNRVLQKMLDNMESKFTKEMREEAKKRGFTTHEALTLASVIEQEGCGFYDEMPRLSAVFQNRLNNWAPGARLLQSDPSMKYPYGNGSYDTYQHEGLPPGPMCSVTEQALRAAVYPDTSCKAYFFVTDVNHQFYFNETLAQHSSTIQSLKRKGIWDSNY